jgi:hypothetical protein
LSPVTSRLNTLVRGWCKVRFCGSARRIRALGAGLDDAGGYI